jgi:hypothetical protein
MTATGGGNLRDVAGGAGGCDQQPSGALTHGK